VNHSELTVERWARFTLPQQILQIAAEMHRARVSFGASDAVYLRSCYERALRLLDLTLELPMRDALRRELSSWRWFVTELKSSDEMDAIAHGLALRTLLQTNPETIQHVTLLGLEPA